MLGRMKRSRLWGGVTLLAVVTLFACAQKQLNGQDCLKNFDCESERCVEHFCVEPPSSPTTATDTGAVATDSGPADTGPAETGSVDGGSDAMGETSDASSD